MVAPGGGPESRAGGKPRTDAGVPEERRSAERRSAVVGLVPAPGRSGARMKNGQAGVPFLPAGLELVGQLGLRRLQVRRLARVVGQVVEPREVDAPGLTGGLVALGRMHELPVALANGPLVQLRSRAQVEAPEQRCVGRVAGASGEVREDVDAIESSLLPRRDSGE